MQFELIQFFSKKENCSQMQDIHDKSTAEPLINDTLSEKTEKPEKPLKFKLLFFSYIILILNFLSSTKSNSRYLLLDAFFSF